MFVHADIAGARYNTRQQAHVGLDTKDFPADIPTYSGHYHLPHTVPNTSITYVGSPFQRACRSLLALCSRTPCCTAAILTEWRSHGGYHRLTAAINAPLHRGLETSVCALSPIK